MNSFTSLLTNRTITLHKQTRTHKLVCSIKMCDLFWHLYLVCVFFAKWNYPAAFSTYSRHCRWVNPNLPPVWNDSYWPSLAVLKTRNQMFRRPCLNLPIIWHLASTLHNPASNRSVSKHQQGFSCLVRLFLTTTILFTMTSCNHGQGSCHPN